jgi:GNAT superfamily N-acetyltransferase
VSEQVPGFVLSDDPRSLDVVQVHRWLSERAYWALGRSMDLQRKAIDGSRVYGIRRLDDPVVGAVGAQVAFARAVTDGATFAWVCDVFVEESVRGLGLGRWLVGHIVQTLEQAGVARVVLATRDAHEVYAAVGFQPLANPVTWMERDRRPQRLAPGSLG